MSMSSEIRAVRELISLACRTHGRKRGWHAVARTLGVTERWVKSASYGEPIATPDPIRVQAARNALARQRAEQIRAELAQIEEASHAGEILDPRQPSLWGVR
jgi:hypothetical protein